MEVYSNLASQREDYVEVALSRASLRRNGRPFVGWSISSNVFSHSTQYEGLIDLSIGFADRKEAEQRLLAVAQQFGLEPDIGLQHRRKLWSV